MRFKRKRLNRAQREKRREKMAHLGVAALTVVCVCGVALMAVFNAQPTGSRYTYTTPNDIWYVENGHVQVAAPAEVSPAPTIAPTPLPEKITSSASDRAAARAARIGVVEAPTPDPTRAPASILITAVGDCTLGTYTTGDGKRSNFKSYVDKYGYEYFLENVRALFEKDDLTIVNLEGPLTTSTDKRPRRAFNFRGRPEYANILASSSVEICNLANNHALDYGKTGFQDTCKALEEYGIGYSGYGPEYYTQVNGYTVGSLGFTEWNFEEADILSKVKAANEKCDLLIVSMHWGKEHHYEMSAYCRRMGRALIDAGADLVVGTHSHVYGEIEKYNGKYIITSLGNFCFGGNDDPHVQDCVIFRQKFNLADGQATDGGIDIIPALISSNEELNDFQPRISEPERGAALLSAIKRLSPTLTEENVIWLEDSYVLTNSIVPGQQAAPPDAAEYAGPSEAAPAVDEAAPVIEEAAPTMEIVQDVAR